ncbi:hypothetical protein [Catenuloplanes indicus]|uniref:Nucleic acid-binding protein n=1 Tax=Catenuloplanes indicus TaxID=137267 RepID=A0AAE3VWM6_9ACTN|nr:hypothetical protein [Catenuloplanes indicus]MDQ0364962.1 putative nucleic acid-binding protein [Catenuloplanes indicus]
MGKTALAVHAAARLSHSFPDGHYFVDLRGLSPQPLPPIDVLAQLIRAVSPRTRVIPPRLAEVTDLWCGVSHGKRVLLVLDNAAGLRVSAAFALSYDLLSPDAQRLFRRLPMAAGDTTGIETAAEISATGQRLRTWLLSTTIAAGRWFEPDPAAAESAWPETVPSADAAEAWLPAEADAWLAALREAAQAGEHRMVVDVTEALHRYSDRWLHGHRWHDVFTLSVNSARRLGDAHLQATQLGYLAWTPAGLRRRPRSGAAAR